MTNEVKTPGFHSFKAIYNLWEQKISFLQFSVGFSDTEIASIEGCVLKEFEQCFDENLLLTISAKNLNLRWTITGHFSHDPMEFIVSISSKDEHNSEFFIEAIRIPDKKIKKGCTGNRKCINYNVLTNREKEILKHIVSGLSNQQIATNLYISKNTVDIHRTNIYKKLAVKNLKELLNQFYINLDAYCYCCFDTQAKK